jgi:hypothetical protein
MPSFIPHWATRSGDIDNAVSGLRPGQIVNVHHRCDVNIAVDLSKKHVVTFYSECHLYEDEDEAPKGMPMHKRFAEARALYRTIKAAGGQALPWIEFDAARYKGLGELSGKGNTKADYAKDMQLVYDAGWKYVAKSPTFTQYKNMIAKYGHGFVPQIVYEDVTVDDGYHNDLEKIIAISSGTPITCIVHSGAYGGAQGTTLSQAKNFPWPTSDQLEIWYGKSTSLQLIRAGKQKYEVAPSKGEPYTSPPAIKYDQVVKAYVNAYNSTLTLRGGPGTEYEKLAVYPHGAEVTVARNRNDKSVPEQWVRVVHPGTNATIGFMNKLFLHHSPTTLK